MQLNQFLPICALLAFTGCAAATTSATPEARTAVEAIGAANSAGARDDFSASIYLRLAEKELAASQGSLGVESQGLARRARADAEVAAMLMYERTARDSTQRTVEEGDRIAIGLAPRLLAPRASTPARSAAFSVEGLSGGSR